MNMRAAIFILSVIVCSCSERRPGPPPSVLTPDRFAELYADLLKEGVRSTSAMQDSATRRHTVDSLLGIYGTTRDAVRASVDWYSRDLATWKVISDSVTMKLEREQNIRR